MTLKEMRLFPNSDAFFAIIWVILTQFGLPKRRFRAKLALRSRCSQESVSLLGQ
jgi:hypothetical protein